VHTGSSPAQEMARGRAIQSSTHAPIVHARRGSGRRADGQYLHPTLSGHLAGHAARAPAPVASGPGSNAQRMRLGRTARASPRPTRFPAPSGAGPPQPAWTAGAHDPGGPTLAASPRRGALQAQQRRHPRRVTPLALLDLGNPAPNGPSDDQRLRGWGSHGCRGHPFRPVSPTCTAGSAPRPLVTVSPSAWSRSISRSLALAAVFVVPLALRVIRLPRASYPRAAVAIQRCRDSSQCSPPSPRLRRVVTTRPA
jgi:hypothetical protein